MQHLESGEVGSGMNHVTIPSLIPEKDAAYISVVVEGLSKQDQSVSTKCVLLALYDVSEHRYF